MKIRRATIDDVPGMVALGQQMHNESNYRGLEWDPDKTAVSGYEMLRDPERYFMAVAEHDGVLIGMYMGFVADAFFSRDKLAYDILLFVRQDRRGGVAAKRLIQVFERWAFAQGVSEIRPGVSTGVHADRTTALYQALGFTKIGSILRKTRSDYGRTIATPDSTHSAAPASASASPGSDG